MVTYQKVGGCRAFRSRPKRRLTVAPKFYFADVGVVNHLSQRNELSPRSELFGKAFENWVGHELRAYNHYHDRFFSLSYWRLSTGVEVDFIVGDMLCAVEAKTSERPRTDDMNGLRELVHDHPEVKRRIVINLEPKRRLTDDGIEILPVAEFIEDLWSGKLF